MNASDVIVIYPGRFHPFHKGHKHVYDLLNSKYTNVYIATTEKVDAVKSPFSFDEKVTLMNLTGVQKDKILKVKQTYNGDEYKSRFNNKYSLIFVVSEKDMLDDPRFNFPASGLGLKKNGEPAYLQKMPQGDNPDLNPMADTRVPTEKEPLEDREKGRGYIMTVQTETFKVGGHDVNSASQIRSLLGTENIDDAKQAFVDLYDKYNETVFNMIRNKLGTVKTMENIDLNELRRMAGLEERDIDGDDDYSNIPGFKEKPMFDQLGKIIDSFEMSQDGSDDIKNPLSTVKTDDGEQVEISVGEARALKQMMEMLSSARQGEVKSAREKFLDSIQKSEGLHSMLEFARSKGLVEESDVISEEELAETIPHMYALKKQGMSVEEIAKKLGMKPQEVNDAMSKTEESVEELDLNDIRADFGVHEGKDKVSNCCGAPIEGEIEDNVGRCSECKEMCKCEDNVDEGKMKDMAMDMADAFYDKVSAITDQSNDLGKAVIDAWNDEEENPPEWALDEITRDVLVDAGLIEPEQEEQAEESFDPAMEPTEESTMFDDAMEVHANEGEQALAQHLGMSEQEFDQELNEYCALRGKHADDDREEAIEGLVQEIIDEREKSDHAEPSVDEDMARMRELAGMPAITETEYWKWDQGSYKPKDGYDANFDFWSQEAQSARSKNGDEPFKSREEMIDIFDQQLEKYNINIFKQKQISQMKADEKAKAEREKYAPRPKQTELDL